MPTTIQSEVFGKSKDGRPINRHTLSNTQGVSVQVIDYAGAISAIKVPDRSGSIDDICLGFETLKEYEDNGLHFGALIGRYANRIAGGRFDLEGKSYQLYLNNGTNSLHGGLSGFEKKVWQSSVKGDKLQVVYVSPDGEEKYPGELTLMVSYSLDDNNALTIDYQATTTKATPVNFTNHAYFNIGGHSCGKLDDHVITINAESYLPLDENSVPSGLLRMVKDIEYDLRNPVRLGERLSQVNGGRGFDNTFCLNNNGSLVLAARVEHPPSGRVMECHTTEPSLHFYTGSNLRDLKGKEGASYGKFGSFCLEAQHYPDSVHHSNFPNVILRPGEVYRQKTVYTFGLMK